MVCIEHSKDSNGLERNSNCSLISKTLWANGMCDLQACIEAMHMPIELTIYQEFEIILCKNKHFADESKRMHCKSKIPFVIDKFWAAKLDPLFAINY